MRGKVYNLAELSRAKLLPFNDPQTIRKLVKEGKLRAQVKDKGAFKYVFTQKAVLDFLKTYQ